MTALKRSPNLAIVERDDHITVLALDGLAVQATPVVIAGSGLEVWDLIDDTRTLEQIVALLSAKFPDVDLRADVEGFVAGLVQSGLVAAS